jgi:hypothetical protein
MKLSNRVYNYLKWFITIFLPAVGALYFGLAEMWGFPNPTGVNGTINLIIAFLGILIGVSTRQYNKEIKNEDIDGDLIITEVDGEKWPMLGVNQSIESMQAKDTVRLTVVDKTGENSG